MAAIGNNPELHLPKAGSGKLPFIHHKARPLWEQRVAGPDPGTIGAEGVS